MFVYVLFYKIKGFPCATFAKFYKREDAQEWANEHDDITVIAIRQVANFDY